MEAKVLITGANGLLGQKLVELFIGPEKGNYELVATGRGPDRLPYKSGYTYRQVDICDRDAVLKLISDEKPDFIIHGAAMTNVDQCETEKEECEKANVEAVQYIVEAADKVGAFLVHISTDFIFDGEDGPYAEEAAPNPVSNYGASKLRSEEILRRSSLEWAIVRTVLVYGIAHDMSRSNIILWVKKSLEEGKQIQVVNDQWRTPTLAEDLAKGCLLIIKKKARGVFNISGKEMLTPYDIALKTAEYFGLDKSLISESDGSKFKQTAKRPPKTGLLLDKAEEILDYKPTSFDKGLEILDNQLKKVK